MTSYMMQLTGDDEHGYALTFTKIGFYGVAVFNGSCFGMTIEECWQGFMDCINEVL